MSELVHEQSNELSKKAENRRSLARRVLRGGRASEQEEEYEYKSYWSDTGKDLSEAEEWEELKKKHPGDPRGAAEEWREKKREEERRRKPKDQYRCDPIPKPDFTYGAVKRKDACPRPQEGERQAIDLQQSYLHPSADPFPIVRDLENQECAGAGSKKLLENPLRRLLELEAREQELEKKKEEFGKTGCLLENNRSDEGGENPHGEID
jgi:hypothetical protein